MKNASYPIIRSANEENLRAVTQCTLATCLLIAPGFIIDTYLNPLQCPQVKHSSPTHHTYSAPPQQLLKPSKEALKKHSQLSQRYTKPLPSKPIFSGIRKLPSDRRCPSRTTLQNPCTYRKNLPLIRFFKRS